MYFVSSTFAVRFLEIHLCCYCSTWLSRELSASLLGSFCLFVCPIPFPMKTFSTEINQRTKSLPRIDQHRAFSPYGLVSPSSPNYKSRNFEDEPVTLHIFHFPRKTVPTRMFLRGWLWDGRAWRTVHGSEQGEEKAQSSCPVSSTQ